MQRILVIGATGTVGRQVVAHLPRDRVRVRALTREPERARLPSHVEVVRGDLTAPETLAVAADGVDAIFLVWTVPAPTLAAAMGRLTTSARRIVLLSSPHKTQHPLFAQPNPLRGLHRAIEAAVAAAPEWTILRPGMFAANATGWWAPQIRAGDTVRWPFLALPTAPIHERDIAAVAVRALIEDGHAGREYVLTGPESLTHAEQIGIIGRTIGRRLRPEEMSPEDARRELLAIMPPPVIDMLLNAWIAAAGHPAFMTSTVEEITGRPARKFSEWAADHASDFLD
jgi:uncharacterized protein YbjT (DUF2867 family)